MTSYQRTVALMAVVYGTALLVALHQEPLIILSLFLAATALTTFLASEDAWPWRLVRSWTVPPEQRNRHLSTISSLPEARIETLLRDEVDANTR